MTKVASACSRAAGPSKEQAISVEGGTGFRMRSILAHGLLHSLSIFAFTSRLTTAYELTAVKPHRLDESKVVAMLLSDTGMVRREPKPQLPKVVCETTQGTLTIQLDPDQSPQGARRFLDLVRDGFFSDQAIFKAVRGFMAQFGISDSAEMNEKWSPTIPDDDRKTDSFPKGTVILAADRHDSRSTQVSIALSDLTGRIGRNPWETPIGHVVDKDLPVLDKVFTGYADAVDEQELLRHGNSYLREFYPRLDFVQACSVPGDPVAELARMS